MGSIWIGIDPGLKGALCAVDEKGQIVKMDVMPVNEDGIDPVGIKAWLHTALTVWGPTVKVALEKAQAMPGQGGVSMFNYGAGYGAIRAVLACLQFPTTLVRPQTWTKVMHQGTDGGDAKDRSRVAALRLWPGQDWKATTRCKVAHDGQIDASLIAEWCRRVVG